MNQMSVFLHRIIILMQSRSTFYRALLTLFNIQHHLLLLLVMNSLLSHGHLLIVTHGVQAIVLADLLYTMRIILSILIIIYWVPRARTIIIGFLLQIGKFV